MVRQGEYPMICVYQCQEKQRMDLLSVMVPQSALCGSSASPPNRLPGQRPLLEPCGQLLRSGEARCRWGVSLEGLACSVSLKTHSFCSFLGRTSCSWRCSTCMACFELFIPALLCSKHTVAPFLCFQTASIS